MNIEFDAAKDEANRFKHGVSLAFGARLFDDDNHLIVSSFRLIDGEYRHKIIACVEGKLWTAIHVWRGDMCRMISVRRSNRNEQGNYDSDSG